MAKVTLFVAPAQGSAKSGDLVRILRQVSGIVAIHPNPSLSQVTVAYHPNKADTFALVTAVEDIGYVVMTDSFTLPVRDMNCSSCALRVENALTDVPGVIEVEVDLRAGAVLLTIAAESVSSSTLIQAVAAAGYRASLPELIS